MQAFHLALALLFHFEEDGTTLLNGAVRDFGQSIFILHVSCLISRLI